VQLFGAGQRVGQVAGQAVPGGQHLPDPPGHVPGQLARGVRRLVGQVLDLVEEIFELAGVRVPAVVRIAVRRLLGQLGQDLIEVGAQLGGLGGLGGLRLRGGGALITGAGITGVGAVGGGPDPGQHRGDGVRAGRLGVGPRRRAGAARVQAAEPDADADLGAVHRRPDLRAGRGQPGHPARQGLRAGEHAVVHDGVQRLLGHLDPHRRHPVASSRRTRSWPSAISSVGSRGPVSFPISSWYSRMNQAR